MVTPRLQSRSLTDRRLVAARVSAGARGQVVHGQRGRGVCVYNKPTTYTQRAHPLQLTAH